MPLSISAVAATKQSRASAPVYFNWPETSMAKRLAPAFSAHVPVMGRHVVWSLMAVVPSVVER